MSQPVPNELIKAAWVRVAPSIEQRIVTLEAFVGMLDRGASTAARLEVARTEAHRLAGSLGSYGLAEGTARAREVESVLSEEPIEVEALRSAIAALGEIVARGPD